MVVDGIDGCSVENTIKIIDNPMEELNQMKINFVMVLQMILSFTRYLRIR